jgi:hypothetical protein
MPAHHFINSANARNLNRYAYPVNQDRNGAHSIIFCQKHT